VRSRSRVPLRTAALAAALLLALTGCGGKSLYPVEGVVQYEDGTPARPLSGGTVSLESVADRSNASGQIQSDGTFRIKDPLGKDGVAAGSYRVIVLPPEGADRRVPPVDPAFGRYETSGIEITVKEEPNKVTVVVRRPAGAKKG
jgi:hypothetical protein